MNQESSEQPNKRKRVGGYGDRSVQTVGTPKELYNALNALYHFTFDACPKDSLLDYLAPDVEWGAVTFVNPPFGNIKPWLKKAVKECGKGRTVVVLMPVRTSAKYWNKYVWKAARHVDFLQGKITFEGYNTGFPQGMCVVVYHWDGKPKDKAGFGYPDFSYGATKFYRVML